MKPRHSQLLGTSILLVGAVIVICNSSVISSKYRSWRHEQREERNRDSRLQLFAGYLESAKTGDPVAQYDVGGFYAHGVAVERNPEEAVKWWLKSAASGYARAQSELGDCFSNGVGVTQDVAAGLNWHRLAAAHGDARSQIWLSKQYLDGGVVAIDKVEAYAYLTLAKRYAETSLRPSEKSTVSSHSLLFSIDPAVTEETRTIGNKRADVLQKEIEAKIAAKKASK
jgi:TPR repeat protein